MSKPRIFVSSTYYDLKHIRRSIEGFIEMLGYEAILFESGDIPFAHLNALDQSCYREIEGCHMLVLVIGGRYGSLASDHDALTDDDREKAYSEYNSITKREYETARDRDIPIFIFVEKPVAGEYRTYKENINNQTIKYAHVDSVNIFKLLDEIYYQKRNNLTREFENVEDITSWLRDQWAGLFALHISKQSTESRLNSLSDQLVQLKETSEVLKKYTESIMLGTKKDESARLIQEVEEKLHRHRVARALLMQPIKFLRSNMTENPTADQLFEALQKSDSVNDFIAMFSFNSSFSKRLNDGLSIMTKDYNRLKAMMNDDFSEDIEKKASV